MPLLPVPQNAVKAAAAVALVGLAAFVRWLVQPVVLARRHNRLEHPSEDVFKEPASGNMDQDTEVLKGFPRLSDAPTKLVSVVVPALDETARLPRMLDAALAYLGERSRKDASFTFEILVVDDGSSDGTSDLALGYVTRLGTDVVRLCTLHCNQGKGAATRKGMLRMRGQYGLLADADAATDIRDLGRLLEKIQKIEIKTDAGTFGVAIGSRAHMEEKAIATRAWHRTVMMRVFHWCVALFCSRKIKDTQCGFKLFTRDAAHVLFESIHLDRWAFDVELVYLCEMLGIPMVEVAVNWEEVPGSKLIASSLDVITTSATMLRDMICVRFCYASRIWRVNHSVLRGSVR